jgi:hypothetical protein
MILPTLLIIFGINAFAVNMKTVQDLLPPTLKTIRVHQSTIQEVTKKLGSPDYHEGKKLYWIKNGLKYAIQMEFNDKDQLKSMSYIFTNNPPPLSALGIFDQRKLSLGERFLELKEKNFDIQLDPTTRTISRIKLR